MKNDDIWNDIFGEDFKLLNQRIESIFSEMNNFHDLDFKTYGYTMYQGPDGVPHFHEFGNAKEEYCLKTNTIEPFSDITVENDVVRVTLEIPGVQKQDIILECTEDSLCVQAQTARRTFTKILALPCDIQSDTARATYNNGILEVVFDIAGTKDMKKRIEIK